MLADLWHGTVAVPIVQGIVVSAGFFIIAFALTYNPYRYGGIPAIRVWWVTSLFYAGLAWRYMESAWVFHQPLREGLWPVVWTTCSVAGVFLGAGKHHDSGAS